MGASVPRQPTEALLIGLQGISIAIFVLLVAAGLFSDQGDWDRNILPVAVWVVWWVGMAFVCTLVGEIWALVNPWGGDRPPHAAPARKMPTAALCPA